MSRKWFFVPLVGNFFEWYEFAIFSSLSTIIGKIFFNNSDPVSATISGFMIYGVAYLSRPFGTFFFGYLGDKYGRKKALSVSLLVMFFATVIIPFLPVYSEMGIKASLLLVLVRIVQGFSLGGEFSSVVTYTCEHAKDGNKAFFGSLQSTAPCVGVLFGLLTMIGLNGMYSAEEMTNFAWKIPFYFAICFGVIALFVRLFANETDEFLKMKNRNQIVKNPFMYFFKNHFRVFLNCSIVVFTLSAIAQTFVIGSKSILEIVLHFDAQTSIMLSIVIIVLSALSGIFSGYICDKINLRFMRYLYIIFLIFGVFFGIGLMSQTGYVGFFGLLLICLTGSLFFGLYPYYLYTKIPVECRDTGVGFSIGIPAVICGGFGMPVLISLFKTYSFSGIFIFCAIILYIAVIGLFFENEKK